MNLLTDSANDFFEFEGELELIALESEQVEIALEMSRRMRNDSRRWQVYQQNLALIAFENWLHKREPRISINRENPFLQPQYSNVVDAVCNLRTGKFKVCLIPFSFTDVEVAVPRAVVDLPEFAAHLYVVVSLEEELEVAAVRGFIRHDQLMDYRSELQPEVDWNYHLPLAWFNCESNELLLYLKCLAPTAIPLPDIPTNRQSSLAQMRAAILKLLPQLHNRPLWQILTWEQGVAVLTTPALLDWLYQSVANNKAALTNGLSDLLQILSQQAVNVRQWLRNQIDEVAQVLAWEVLPAPSALLSTIRSTEPTPAQELEGILADIKRSNQLEIPAIAGCAYRDILLESPLRLYAVTWSLPDQDSGWTLLLVLKAIPGHQPHSGLRLRVSDQTGVLAEEELQGDRNHDYIFTLLEGSYEDKFLATITLANGEAQTLPPFEFPRETND